MIAAAQCDIEIMKERGMALGSIYVHVYNISRRPPLQTRQKRID